MPPRKVQDCHYDNGTVARFCGSCRSWFPLTADFFYCSRSVKSLTGFSPQCIPCHNKSNKRTGKRFRLKVRDLVLHAYGGDSPVCACCNEPHIEFLSVDHIEGGGRKHRKKLSGHFYAWLVRNNYPPGFRILCHNCNFALGRYGYCPHHPKNH